MVALGRLQQFSFDEPGIDVSFDERSLVEDLFEQRDGGVDAIDVKLVERSFHAANGFVASGSVDNEFSDQ
jgi:hypothetical protein